MTKLTKADLIESLAGTVGLTKADAGRAIDHILTTIHDQAAAGARVELRGFGAFEMRSRAARQGRNPGTGATIQIPASTGLHFKASKAGA